MDGLGTLYGLFISTAPCIGIFKTYDSIYPRYDKCDARMAERGDGRCRIFQKCGIYGSRMALTRDLRQLGGF